MKEYLLEQKYIYSVKEENKNGWIIPFDTSMYEGKKGVGEFRPLKYGELVKRRGK